MPSSCLRAAPNGYPVDGRRPVELPRWNSDKARWLGTHRLFTIDSSFRTSCRGIFAAYSDQRGSSRRWPTVEVLRGIGSRPLPCPREGCPPACGVSCAIMAAARKPVVEVRRSERRRRTVSAYRDSERAARARRLVARYLAEYPAAGRPASIRWVRNQNGRWGPCTPTDRTIRISDRLMDMPDWVIDYVLLHELVHLVVPSHSPR